MPTHDQPVMKWGYCLTVPIIDGVPHLHGEPLIEFAPNMWGTQLAIAVEEYVSQQIGQAYDDLLLTGNAFIETPPHE